MTFSTQTLLFASALLFFSASFGAAADGSQAGSAVTPPPVAPAQGSVPTVITSDRGEVQTLEKETQFILTGDVRVTGNNLTVLCDRLEVYSLREGADDSEESVNETDATDDGSITAGLVKPSQIRLILAIGNVQIRQEGREATAGRAEVFPIEGRIVLTESPVIRNDQGVVAAEIITFYQGEERAVIEGGKSGPARITLPTLPDLGADAESGATEENDRGD